MRNPKHQNLTPHGYPRRPASLCHRSPGPRRPGRTVRLAHRVLILILLPALTGVGVSLLSLTAERQVEARLAKGDQAAALVRATYELVAVSHDLFGGDPSPQTQDQVDLALGRVVDLVGNLAQRGILDGTALAQAESNLGGLRTLVANLVAAARTAPYPARRASNGSTRSWPSAARA